MLFGSSILLGAKGTLAGTSIPNQAQIAYVVGGIDNNLTSNTDEFVVDRIIDVHISWQDNAPVQVSAGDPRRVLTFRATNLGNSDENMTLTYDHNTTSDFAPTNIKIYQDTDGDGHFDPAVDTEITMPVGLANDANMTIFIVSDIPDTATPSQKSLDGVTVAVDANATAGADDPSAIDTVIRQKSERDQGAYEVRDYWLATQKTQIIHSDDNATHTGTRITYTIDTWIDGNATGQSIGNVVITDPIPSGTAYTASSLVLDGTSLSDAADGDAGEVVGGVVTVRIGTLSGTTHKKVSFDVEVQ
jgi:uncharacterized repeat protein (TIGR01451 family)